jgi:uroporphyrinogen decarboxylase
MCQTPELCAEATLQPLRRFPTLDAVVIFSDILIVPQAMGLEVRMEPGPVFPTPLLSPEDLGRLILKPDAAKAFAYLYEGIALTKAKAVEMGRPVPVIGFCGAPWTLMQYCIDSGPPAVHEKGALGPDGAPKAKATDKGHEKSRSWLYRHPSASHSLLAAITDVCIDLLVGQYTAGASVLQVFESSAGELTPELFSTFALPCLARIAAGVRARTPAVADGGPVLLVFARCQHSWSGLEGLCDSAYDGMSVDWGWDAFEAGRRVAAECARLGRRPMLVQGNVDPAALFAPLPVLARETAHMLARFRAGAAAAGQAPLPHIVNLGHGMVPSHSPEALGAMFLAAHVASAALVAGRDEGEAAEAAVAAVAAAALPGAAQPLQFIPAQYTKS